MNTRHFWLLFHRYAGLFMALFLVIIGLTGSIIVFNAELFDWFNPPPKVAPRAGGILDPFTLRERAEALVTHGAVNGVPLHPKPDAPYLAFLEPKINPASGEPYTLDANSVMIDPYSGAELRRENANGEIWPINHATIMTLVNRLHYQMALPGSVGSNLFGIVALVWTLDCFVSAYLTFPLSLRRRASGARATVPAAGQKSWLARWKPAWLVKWNGSAYRVNFDLHRAGGLWVWLLLLAIAWSSVGFNLGEEVYLPVMRNVFAMPDPYGAYVPRLAKPKPEPDLAWRAAHQIGARLMAEQARVKDFRVISEESLTYLSDKGVFMYVVRSDRDLISEGGTTTVLFADRSGDLIATSVPTGDNLGSTLHSWIYALHMAQIWGLPFRLFISLTGLLVTMLSVTGVYIWIKKRSARAIARRQSEAARGLTPAIR